MQPPSLSPSVFRGTPTSTVPAPSGVPVTKTPSSNLLYQPSPRHLRASSTRQPPFPSPTPLTAEPRRLSQETRNLLGDTKQYQPPPAVTVPPPPTSLQQRQARSHSVWADDRRMREVSRPPSSQSVSRFGFGQQPRHQQPTASTQQEDMDSPTHSQPALYGHVHGQAVGLVDRYTPTPQPSSSQYGGTSASAVNGNSGVRPIQGVGQRNGADLYIQNVAGGGKAAKGDQILAALADMKDALSERMDSLESDNRQLRDQVHEMTMAQRALATREEMIEEITAQLSPALHEFFDSLNATLRSSLAPLPAETARLSSGQVRTILVEFNEAAKAEQLRESQRESDHQRALHQPLMTLMTHLITRLSTLDEISTTLTSLKDLPRAIKDVAVFKQCLDAVQNRLTNQSPPQQAAIQSYPGSPKLLESIAQLQNSLRDIDRKLVDDHSARGVEPEKILDVLEGIQTTMSSIQQKQQVPVTPGVDPEDFNNLVDVVGSLNEQLTDFMNKQAAATAAPQSAGHIKQLETAITEIRLAIRTFTTLQQQQQRPLQGAHDPQLKAMLTPSSNVDISKDSLPPTQLGDPSRPLFSALSPRNLSSQSAFRPYQMRSQPEQRMEANTDVFGPVHFVSNALPAEEASAPQSTHAQSPPIAKTNVTSKKSRVAKKPRTATHTGRPFTRSASHQVRQLGLDEIIDISTSSSNWSTPNNSAQPHLPPQSSTLDAVPAQTSSTQGDAAPGTMPPPDSLLGSSTLLDAKAELNNSTPLTDTSRQAHSTSADQVEQDLTLPIIPAGQSRLAAVRQYGSGGGGWKSGEGLGAGFPTLKRKQPMLLGPSDEEDST